MQFPTNSPISSAKPAFACSRDIVFIQSPLLTQSKVIFGGSSSEPTLSFFLQHHIFHANNLRWLRDEFVNDIFVDMGRAILPVYLLGHLFPGHCLSTVSSVTRETQYFGIFLFIYWNIELSRD